MGLFDTLRRHRNAEFQRAVCAYIEALEALAQGPQGIQGPPGADGDDGAQGIQGIQGIQGVQGVPGILGSVTPSTPARTLGSAGYQPSTTKPVLVIYSVQITCTASLAGAQDGKVELRSDANSTPTTVRAVAQNRNSVALAIALTVINEQTTTLVYLVPAGHYVRLVSTQTAGTPAFAIISQVEIELN